MTPRLIPVALLAAGMLTGCVTKQYGRQEALTDRDKQIMACGDIDGEIAKVDAWQHHVDQRSQYDGWDALAVLGDFGVGNSIERSEALKSADERRGELRQLRVAKACPGPVIGQNTR